MRVAVAAPSVAKSKDGSMARTGHQARVRKKKSAAGSTAEGAGGAAAAARRWAVPALRHGVVAGAVLVMATPLVVTPGTIFPSVVGKALYSRVLIEIVFALWAALAALRPEYRPPRSWLLVLLGAGLASALLSTAFGVSFERSFWSDYRRMQGVMAQAHWFALALVLASVFRDPAAWRALFGLQLGVGAVVAALALASYAGWEVPFYGTFHEADFPRIGGTAGNPILLGAYMVVNAVLACGLAARALALPARAGRRLAASLGWGALAAVHAGGLVLAGTSAGYLALVAALGAAALGGLWLARGRWRALAGAALALAGALAAVAALRLLDPAGPAGLPFDAPVLDYVAEAHIERPSVQARLGVWRAGLEGLAARPLLGWGPENFDAVFGRFARGYAAASGAHDRAHNALVETAAATGAVGLAAWLALWGLTFAVVWRALPSLAPPERMLALFAGAALAGRLAQNQFQFDTAASLLQYVLLLGFAASLEPAAFPGAAWPRLPARLRDAARAGLKLALPRPPGRAWACLAPRRWAWTALALAALAVAVAGAGVHRDVHRAANGQHYAARPVGSTGIEEAIDGFPALAGYPRNRLFEDFGARWTRLRAERGAAALSLLAWVDGEAVAALAAEPENWFVVHWLARMYSAVASTEPDYRARAQWVLARARELAPNRAVFPPPLTAPVPLGAAERADGGLDLAWRPGAGAAYQELAACAPDGRRRALGWVYAPAPGRRAVPAAARRADERYWVRACAPPACSAWAAFGPAPPRAEGRRRCP